MILDYAAYARLMQALLPPGKAWTREPDATLTKALTGASREFARVQSRADALLAELQPSQAVELLAEHELANGLPDTCNPVVDTVSNRRAALLAKLGETRGHAAPDYLAIAADFGHAATLYKKPYHVARVGLRAGMRANEGQWASVLGIAYATNLVSSPNATSGWFRYASGATADAGVSPSGATDADRFSITSGDSGYTYTDLSTTVGAAGAMAVVWVRSEGVDVPMHLRLAIGTTDASATFVASKAWRRFTVRINATTTSTIRMRVGAEDVSGSTRNVLLWGARCGLIDKPFECVFKRNIRQHIYPDFRVIGDQPYPEV